MAELRGYSSGDQINTLGDAYRILDLEPGADDDDISDKIRELTREYHPDVGGDSDLFSAIQLAANTIREAIDNGSVDNPQVPAQNQTIDNSFSTTVGPDIEGPDRGPSQIDRDTGPDTEASGATTGGQGFEDDFADEVRQTIYDRLRNATTEEDLKEQYGPNATFENVADVLTTFLLMGTFNLGDLEKIVTGDERFRAGPSGGDPRFQKGPGGGDPRFSKGGRGGDDRFQ